MIILLTKIILALLIIYFWGKTILFKYNYYGSLSQTYLSVLMFKFIQDKTDITKKINRYNLISLILFLIGIAFQIALIKLGLE